MISNLYILKTQGGINILDQLVLGFFFNSVLRAILTFGIFYYTDD